MTMTKTRGKNPTQADVIRILILQEKADTEKRLAEYQKQDASAIRDGNIARTRGAVAVLEALLRKVERYLAGDLNVLIR